MCRKEFPEVQYLDYVGQFGRRGARRSSVPLYFSTPDAKGKQTDYLPVSYVEADYLVNMANLKSHGDYAGITLCAKNHYGSLVRTPPARGYFDMHKDLPFVKPGMGRYRCLVDLLGVEFDMCKPDAVEPPTPKAPQISLPGELLSRMKSKAELYEVTDLKACLWEVEAFGPAGKQLADQLRNLVQSYDMEAVLEILSNVEIK